MFVDWAQQKMAVKIFTCKQTDANGDVVFLVGDRIQTVPESDFSQFAWAVCPRRQKFARTTGMTIFLFYFRVFATYHFDGLAKEFDNIPETTDVFIYGNVVSVNSSDVRGDKIIVSATAEDDGCHFELKIWGESVTIDAGCLLRLQGSKKIL